MAVEELDLIADRLLEGLVVVDLEVIDRIAMELGSGRSPGRLDSDLGGSDLILLGELVEDRAADAPRAADRPVVGQQGDDPVVFPGEQGVGRGQGDVLVGPLVTGHHRVCRLPPQPAVDLHRRRGLRVAPAVHPGQVPVRHEQGRGVVPDVAVDRSGPQELQPLLGAAVDRPGVDVGTDVVDLLARVVDAGPRRRGRAGEADDAEVVDEVLHRVLGVEGDVRRLALRVTGGPAGAEPERVVEELSPGEAPLADPPLGEDVLVDVVDDAVADEPGVGAADHLAPAVGVAGRGHPAVGGPRLPPVGVRLVVSAAVQALDLHVREARGTGLCAGGARPGRRAGQDQRGEGGEERPETSPPAARPDPSPPAMMVDGTRLKFVPPIVHLAPLAPGRTAGALVRVPRAKNSPSTATNAVRPGSGTTNTPRHIRRHGVGQRGS